MLFGSHDKLTFIAGSIVTNPSSSSDNGLRQLNTWQLLDSRGIEGSEGSANSSVGIR